MSSPKTMKVPADWQPGEIAFVLDLVYSANGDEGNDSVVVMRALAQPKASTISTWPLHHGDWFEVTLRFVGARELRLDGFGPGAQQVVGFAIDDSSDRGWEGVTYKVEDYEGGRISFYCNHVAVESRHQLPRAPEFLSIAESVRT